jgi:hypothetical protein
VLCLLWYRYRLACLERPYVALPSCTLTDLLYYLPELEAVVVVLQA